jgi:hypothetical protein
VVGHGYRLAVLKRGQISNRASHLDETHGNLLSVENFQCHYEKRNLLHCLQVGLTEAASTTMSINLNLKLCGSEVPYEWTSASRMNATVLAKVAFANTGSGGRFLTKAKEFEGRIQYFKSTAH